MKRTHQLKLPNTNRSPMQVSIEAILKARGQLRNFNTPNKNGAYEFHLRIDNKPYLPLVIERHGPTVAVKHAYTHNGDAMSDPEIVFKLPAWEAVEITQSPLSVWREKYPFRNGKQKIDTTFAAQVTPLANAWAKELRTQGFVNSGIATSLTHPKE